MPGSVRKIAARLYCVLVILACLTACSRPATGQTAQAPTGASRQFEIVSIHAADPHSSSWSQFKFTADGLIAYNVSVVSIFRNAYPTAKRMDQFAGWPLWAGSIEFGIQAKMSEEDAAAYQKLSAGEQAEWQCALLRSLLAERFHLKMHRDVQLRPAYALTIAKGGPKLTKAASNNAPSKVSVNVSFTAGTHVQAHSENMSSLASMLNHQLPRTVIDRTGLADNFDFDLTFTPDEQQSSLSAGPSLFTALQEQLGLKLEPIKAPIDFFTIDHVEPPTDN